MEILIRLELDGDIRNEDAIRECVYAYLFELIEDDSLDYEVWNVRGRWERLLLSAGYDLEAEV